MTFCAPVYTGEAVPELEGVAAHVAQGMDSLAASLTSGILQILLDVVGCIMAEGLCSSKQRPSGML